MGPNMTIHTFFLFGNLFLNCTGHLLHRAFWQEFFCVIWGFHKVLSVNVPITNINCLGINLSYWVLTKASLGPFCLSQSERCPLWLHCNRELAFAERTKGDRRKTSVADTVSLVFMGLLYLPPPWIVLPRPATFSKGVSFSGGGTWWCTLCPFQVKLLYAPPPSPHFGQKAFCRERGWVCIFWILHVAGFDFVPSPPIPDLNPPHPKFTKFGPLIGFLGKYI